MASYVNGNKKFDVGDGVLTRASAAYNPNTGAVVGTNVPRVASNRIVWNKWRPINFYSHVAGETELNYADFLTALTTWEGINVGVGKYTKISLGLSAGARDMPAYRLGPIGTKHFVVVSVVHGDEHDGMRGELNAMQLLRSRGEFATFRSEWTVLWVPMLNPDGYFANIRNCASGVNLDANFDWFWADYAEASTESKGVAPESEIEVLNLLNYWRTPIPFGFVLDFHANSSPGARYQTRDPILQKITGIPAWGTIPASALEIDIDSQIWKMARTLQTLRLRDEGGLDTKTRAVHTRAVPRLHSYFSSQGIPSLAVEEVKVASAASGGETYKTASDFRLDYILASAAAVTNVLWESEDAILLEPAGTNILTAALMDDWAVGAVSPTGWTPDRIDVTRQPFIKGMIETGDRFYPRGESVLLTPKVNDLLAVASEYTRSANSRLYQDAIMAPVDKALYLLSLQGVKETSGIITRNEVWGAGMAGTGVNQYFDLLGGGTAAPATGAVTKVSRIRVDVGGIISQADVGNLNAARMMHGCCTNYHSAPGAGNFRMWSFGGFNGAGVRLQTVEVWNPTTVTATGLAAPLPVALAGSLAVYYPPTNKIYIFGGTSIAGTVTTIYVYDPVAITCGPSGTVMLQALTNAAGEYCPGNGKIYIIGGEKTAGGDMSEKVYSFDPTVPAYVEETGFVTTLDNEDVEDGTTRPWNTPIGRNSACLVRESSEDEYGQIIVPGGRLTNAAGALTTSIYTLYPKDEILGPSAHVNFGKFLYGTILNDTRMTEFYSDAFANLIGWDNSAGAWVAGGGFASGVSGLSAWLISNATPTYANQRFLMNLGLTGTGPVPDIMLACRGTFAVGALIDGYYVTYVYDGVNHIWKLSRMNSSVITSLDADVTVTGDFAKQITSAFMRTMEFRVEDNDPVHLTVTYNGYTIFDVYDFDATRITTAGSMGVFGGSS